MEPDDESANMAEELIEIFGHDAFLLATHYIRRFKLHQLHFPLHFEIFDTVAFLVIDDEIARCQAYRQQQMDDKVKGSGKSIE